MSTAGHDRFGEIAERLVSDDLALARVAGRSLARQIGSPLAISGSVLAAGVPILIYISGPLGSGALVPCCILIFIAGYDIPMRLRQLRRARLR
jgi:hypothetical protein